MYLVNKDECTGCGICLDYCPVEAIAIEFGVAEIDQSRCTSCGSCCEACEHNAIYEVIEAPSVHTAVRTASPSPAPRIAISPLRTSSVPRRQRKTAALAVVLPTLSKIMVELADRFLSRRSQNLYSGGDVRLGHGRSTGRAGQGRHRWRGGS